MSFKTLVFVTMNGSCHDKCGNVHLDPILMIFSGQDATHNFNSKSLRMTNFLMTYVAQVGDY